MVPRTGEVDQLDPTDDMEDTVVIAEVEVRRANIEQTRSDISETLDAIKDKLQPQTLIQQAKESVHEVTANVAEKARELTAEAAEKAREVVGQARDTVHTAVQEAREAIPAAAHNAVSSVVDTAKDAVTGVVDTARDAGSSVVDRVRENPMPYALIGLGLGWLYMHARKSPPPVRRYYPGDRSTGDYNRSTAEYPYRSGGMQPAEGYPYRADSARTSGETPYRSGYESGTTYSTAGNSDLDTLRYGDRREGHSGVSDTVRQAREKVGDVADAVHDRAGQMVDQVQDTVSDLGTRTAEQAREMAQGVQRMLEENPLLVGAIAMGIGAAVGFMMPETRVESRMMGDARDRLVENVQQTAHDVVQKVQTVASETLDTAKEKVQDAASDVIDTAKDEARNQGLMPPDTSAPSAGAATTWKSTSGSA